LDQIAEIAYVAKEIEKAEFERDSAFIKASAGRL
jgi:hypothetical protein